MNKNPDQNESETDELFSQLEDVFSKVDEEEVENIQDLSLKTILERLAEENDLIVRTQQILAPSNQESRDAHSRRSALLLELRRRNY